ncbi:hypothetical protein GCM10010439_41750 [Actinocorallia aurantiaca]|uniref:Uncharacterized protein n=1 Tax=Actinocorallia aurantiaca TaxID=46204 RepID=A0ABN3UC43_9ACTN
MLFVTPGAAALFRGAGRLGGVPEAGGRALAGGAVPPRLGGGVGGRPVTRTRADSAGGPDGSDARGL